MPVYEYACDACGVREDVVKSMSEFDRDEICPKCGEPMRKCLSACMPRVHGDSYSREIHSDALAIHPEQRAEHQQLYPDVPLDRECRPVFSSYRQHDRYLEKRGIHKPMKRNRRRETKVN